jgi:hypothetical protein
MNKCKVFGTWEAWPTMNLPWRLQMGLFSLNNEPFQCIVFFSSQVIAAAATSKTSQSEAFVSSL